MPMASGVMADSSEGGGPEVATAISAPAADFNSRSSGSGGVASASSASNVGGTNTQVNGVDEPDIVKTDGEFVYSVGITPREAGSNGGSEEAGSDLDGISKRCAFSFSIVRAFPASSAAFISRTELPTAFSPRDAYLNGDILLLLGAHRGSSSSGSSYGGCGPMVSIAAEPDMAFREGDDGSSTNSNGPNVAARIRPGVALLAYNISNRAAPREVRRILSEGEYVDARLVAGTAYIVTYTRESIIPRVWNGKGNTNEGNGVNNGGGGGYDSNSVMGEAMSDWKLQSECNQVGYVNIVRQAGYTSVLTLPLSSSSSIARVPMDSTVLAYTVTTVYADLERLVLAASDVREESSLALIFALRPATIEFLTLVSDIPGALLNQFSLDIWQGNLRLATTRRRPQSGQQRWNRETDNNLFIYSVDTGARLGAVEGLAPGERIYSVRFLGARVYFVTFRQVDPLFVFDASDPRAPKLLGELKIPGFSEYLHPINATHTIGVGRDASEQGDTRGIKLSLFDSSDPLNPIEAYNTVIGGRNAHSEVESTHRAFRWVPEPFNLAVLPVTEAGHDYLSPVSRQGAFVFRTGPTGFVLERVISHFTPTSFAAAKFATDSPNTYDPNWQHVVLPGDSIRRTLTLDDLLVTVSNNALLLTNLTLGIDTDVARVSLLV